MEVIISQAGIIDFIGTHPQIPTIFVANVGTAIPIANTIELLGATVAAHGVPLQTVASGNTVDFNVQYASAAASSVAGNAGVASFNSTQFTVDANGFVAISGGAVAESFQVDAFTAPGTNPVVPNGSGVVIVTGGQVAAGTTTNVIRTDSLAANTYTIQIQRSQAVAVSTIGDNGVSHFNSTFFTVDANGFVSINGAAIGETITGNTGGALSPTAGNWNIVGTGSITTSGSVSTLTVQLTGLTNHNVLVGAGTATVTNVSPSTSGFVLTSNGVSADPSFQAVSASGAITTITGNSGGAEVPLAGNFNILGTGSITVVGSANTETIQLTGLTNHAVQVGAGTATLTQLAVGTNGQVLIGATTADPAFATLTSSDSSISFTPGVNSLSLQVASGTGVVKTLTGNSGGAISPTAGNINTLGTGSITVVGSGSTLTTQLTGLTNHAIQIGAGTATLTQLGAGTTGQVLQTNTGADPTWSTATYPPTTTVSQILYSSATNVVSGLTTANNGVLITGTTGVPSILPNGTTGQILTATTGSPPSWIAPATSGTVTSVSVVNANGFAGTVATATTTPAITISTTQTGLLSGNGTSITGTAITQFNVLTAGASNAPNSVAPSATSGVPLISQGSSSQPIFGTAVVAGGGTGATSFTAYAPVCGGTTTTAALQSASTGLSTSGFVLTSNGSAALPSFQAVGASGGFSQIVVQKFTSTGTYTPTANMKYCTIEVVGGGGGGGGSAAGGAATGAVGGGGGGGGYGRKTVAAATIGASQAVTIAAASSGGSGAVNGTAGGTCSLGAIVSATGGAGGIAGTANTTVSAAGGAGGVGSGGDVNSNGGPGGIGIYVLIAGVAQMTNGGFGGSSYFGGGAVAVISQAGAANLTGNNGTAYGGGGGGGGASTSSGAGGGVGGNGAQGVVVVTEYI